VYNGSIRDVGTLETTETQMVPDWFKQVVLVVDIVLLLKENLQTF